jgi:hypothetical protein
MRDPGDRLLSPGGVLIQTNLVDGVPYAELRAPLTDDMAWGVEHLLALRGGHLVVEEVRVFPAGAPPPGGLTTRLMRKVTIGAHVDRAAEITRQLFALLEASPLSEESKASLRGAVSLLSAPRGRRPGQRPTNATRPGRKPLGDDVLLAAAQAYISARQAGHRAPVVAAAKGKMTEARMRDLIYRARRRGFLSKTMQGRGGGQLTDEALKLLKDAPTKKPRRPRR